MQQHIKMPALQGSAQIADASQTGFLVKGDKLDAFQAIHQFGLAFPEDPGYTASRQVFLQCTDQRQHMGGVAKCRKP